MAKKSKIKPISLLLNELDKPLYEGRWQDVAAMMKKFGKKATIPEAFNHFLKGAEALDSVMLGESEFTLAEAETRLRRATELCQLGDPGDAALQLLASLKRGQMLWLGGSYEAALRILRENVNSSADTSLLHVCKVLVEGNSYLGLCLDWLSAQQPTSSAASSNNVSLSKAAVGAYEDSLRLSLELVYSAKSQSLSQQPATLKAIKTALERGPMLCMSLSLPERALNFYRKVLHQHKSEDVLKEARHYCVLCMASLLTFHASSSSHAMPQLSSINAYSPSQLPEETMLVSFLSKAFVDTWKVSVDTSLSPACVFDLLTLVLSSQNLCGMMVECLEDSMRFTTHHPHLWLQFCLALVSSGLTKQALAVFHECIDQFPTDPLVLLTGANFALEKADRPDLCVEWASMAVAGVCRGHFLEARMEFLLGRGYSVLSEKETSSKKRQELHKKGLEHLTEAVRLDRGDVVYAFHLAVQLAESRQLSSSKLEVQRALELNAGHTSCLHLLALVLSAEKLYENALKVCEFALQKQPDNFGLLECKIQLEMILHGASHSLKTCKHALHLWRKTYSEEATGLIAIVTQDQRSLSELSLPREHRDIEVNFNPDVESDAGSSHFSVSGTRSQVNQPNVLQARIWCTIADVYLKDSKMSDATSCVREAQCLAPLLPSVILSYGRILQQEGRLQEASQQYQTALTLQPTSPTALTLMGQCQHCLRKFGEAEKYLREATSSDQLNHEAWYWLGETLREQGYYEMAADCFKTALDLEATAPIQPFSVVVSSLVPAS